MKVTVDTNVLVRAVVQDEPLQAQAAAKILTDANRPAVEAGLAVLDAGGDFADGVIAYEGQWLGAETFVSFDKKAVALLIARGQSARQL